MIDFWMFLRHLFGAKRPDPSAVGSVALDRDAMCRWGWVFGLVDESRGDRPAGSAVLRLSPEAYGAMASYFEQVIGPWEWVYEGFRVELAPSQVEPVRWVDHPALLETPALRFVLDGSAGLLPKTEAAPIDSSNPSCQDEPVAYDERKAVLTEMLLSVVHACFPGADEELGWDLLLGCTAYPLSTEADCAKQVFEVAVKAWGDPVRAAMLADGAAWREKLGLPPTVPDILDLIFAPPSSSQGIRERGNWPFWSGGLERRVRRVWEGATDDEVVEITSRVLQSYPDTVDDVMEKWCYRTHAAILDHLRSIPPAAAA